PIYVDIDPETFNIDPEKIAEKITPRTKAILPVHLFGQPCNITRIKEIADANHLYLIEDGAQVVGAKWQGKPACGFGDIATISYYPSKNLGAFGDAGMMTSTNDELAERLRSIANHGATTTYFHDRLGVNSRLDSIQAAILSVKLKYLDQWNARRREIADLYTKYFSLYSDLLRTPSVHRDAEPIWHQYSIMLNGERDRVMASLKADGIPTNIDYPVPLHLQPAYKSYGGKRGDYPLTEYASEHILSLPMHSELSDDDVAYIAENVVQHIRNLSL
ncbi:MAG: DegT/DnrJ/EryC1/StrS family aminotransferase, partial [Ignavibacteriota bacterium]